MTSQYKIWALSAVLVFCASLAHAQDANVDPRSIGPSDPMAPMNSSGSARSGKAPVPAARGVSSANDVQPNDPAQVVPDTTTLAGAEIFSVGSAGQAHNVFDPSLTFSELGQTETSNSAGRTVTATTLLGGSLSFNRMWSRYHLTVAYTGGENLSYGGLYTSSSQNSSFNDLAVSQEIDWERWRIRMRDDFVASSGASFSGAGMGGPGLIGQFSSPAGASLSNIAGAFVPSETIQTGQAMRYRNTALGEVQYSFSRRSAFSVSGSYGVLDFSDAGYVSSRSTSVQAGYDYLLDARNSIAVLGSYNNIDYSGTSTSTSAYMAGLAYGRKITGRLAYQLSGGPEQIRVSNAGTGNFQLLGWAANTALTYERRRTGMSLSYSHGLSGGSGVFVGSKNDTFSASLHHQFSRFWSGSTNVGYAFNRALARSGTVAPSFNDWFLGANLGRELGHHAQVSFNYGLEKQDSPSVCPVTSCGGAGFNQTFGVTMGWHLRAIE